MSKWLYQSHQGKKSLVLKRCWHRGVYSRYRCLLMDNCPLGVQPLIGGDRCIKNARGRAGSILQESPEAVPAQEKARLQKQHVSAGNCHGNDHCCLWPVCKDWWQQANPQQSRTQGSAGKGAPKFPCGKRTARHRFCVAGGRTACINSFQYIFREITSKNTQWFVGKYEI